jgi:molybdate transport system substrate-binding protein
VFRGASRYGNVMPASGTKVTAGRHPDLLRLAKRGWRSAYGPAMIRGLFTAIALVCAAGSARAENATVAVAANFLTTAETLASDYETDSGNEIVLVNGSTGRLYAQIVNGAPFDVFLAADTVRPEALEDAGLVAARKTYALGKLVLVSRDPADATGDLGAILAGRRIALADPAVAPYGAAAVEVLGAAGLALASVDAVYGDSVGQTAALFTTGNAGLAFLAASQVPFLGDGLTTRDLDSLYTPIRQDAVLLAASADNAAAKGFFAYLASNKAAEVIRAAGYGVPE